MINVLTAIPVFNGEAFLKTTLESLARQTHPPDRVVVIDDCSTDGTRALVESFKGLPCELLQNDRNLGLFPNLNRALELAKEAEFFHLLLADDCLRPDFMKTLLASIQHAPKPSFAYCACDEIDAKGKVKPNTKMPSGSVRAISKSTLLRRQSLLKTMAVGSVIIRSGCAALPVRFREDMPHVADCVFYAELACICRERMEVDARLCEIRQHSKNATNQNIHNLDAWVADEFRAMRHIAHLMSEMSEMGWRSILHDHYQRCLFAARSFVKQQWMRKKDPNFARAIAEVVARECSCLHRLIGKTAVMIRDWTIGSHLPQDSQKRD